MLHARNNANYICWILSRVSTSYYQPFWKEHLTAAHAFSLRFCQPSLFLWFIPIHIPVMLIIIGHSSGACHRNILNLITCTLNLLGDIKNLLGKLHSILREDLFFWHSCSFVEVPSRLHFSLLCGEILKRNVGSSFKTPFRGILISESSF